MNILKFTCEQGGDRLDKWLSEKLLKTRNAVCLLINSENVKVGGKAVAKNYRLRDGDEVCVCIPEPVEITVEAQEIPLDIVYEDPDLLVVNKAKGMVVHPAAGNRSGTLVNALLAHCKDSLSGINGKIRPGIVHRIDKDTSGLLIVAKNDFAHRHLAAQIKEHSFFREYHAVCHNRPKPDSGEIDLPIGRSEKNRKKMCVTHKNAKQAITEYTVIEPLKSFSYLSLRLRTGRTHQIRVHLSYIGCPIAGDEVYGPKRVEKGLNGQCLHAKKIGFIHPRTGEYLEFDAPLPAEFTQFLKRLKGKP